MILDPLFGGLNHILVNVLGVLDKAQPWLSDPKTALMSVIVVNVWAGTPFMVILLLAGLKGIEGEQYDAASVDGANAWRRFLHITLPGPALRGDRGDAAGDDLHVQRLHADLSAHQRRPPRRDPQLPDPRLRVRRGGHADQRRRLGGDDGGAADAGVVAGAGALHAAPRRSAPDRGRWQQRRRGLASSCRCDLPIRLLARGIVWLFWLANDLVERALAATARAVRPAGAPGRCWRAEGQRQIGAAASCSR